MKVHLKKKRTSTVKGGIFLLMDIHCQRGAPKTKKMPCLAAAVHQKNRHPLSDRAFCFKRASSVKGAHFAVNGHLRSKIRPGLFSTGYTGTNPHP